MNEQRGWYVFGGLVVLALVFQFFFRYQYVHVGTRIMRIDRLSSGSCYMPCTEPTETPVASDTPMRTFETDDEKAIAAVRASQVQPTEDNHHEYMWRVYSRVKSDGTETYLTQDMSNENPEDYPIRLVCYCYNDTPGQKSPVGVWWEYHLDTKDTYSASDNANLSAKYGLTSSSH